MKIEQTKLNGCFILHPRVFEDERGYFFESYNARRFREVTGFGVDFVQDNESRSQYGVIRGLHAQSGDFAQAKLVRVLSGKVLDVVVDNRPESSTYGQHVSVELTGENKRQFFVPKGFLHGFSVLSETAVFAYKCDNFYNKASETGVYYADPDLNIDWRIPEEDRIISPKDTGMPAFY